MMVSAEHTLDSTVEIFPVDVVVLRSVGYRVIGVRAFSYHNLLLPARRT
jgi:hypothetical protein